MLLEMARRGALDFSGVITSQIPLERDAVERALVELEGFGDDVRTVIVP